VTGSTDEIRTLVVDGFRLALGPREQMEDIVDIAHSGRLVLVDGQGRIRGYYDSDAAGLDEVFHRSVHVLREGEARTDE
jgi:protein SCO1/2